jgi:hypothetical protein
LISQQKYRRDCTGTLFLFKNSLSIEIDVAYYFLGNQERMCLKPNC